MDPRTWLLLPAIALLLGVLACAGGMADAPSVVGTTSARGELQIRSSAAKVTVPPGSFPQGTEVRVRPVRSLMSGVATGELASQVVDVSAGGLQPDRPLTISIPVDRDALAEGQKPSLARWDPDAEHWLPLPTEPWDGGPTVTGTTDHLSFFAALRIGALVGAGLKVLEDYQDGDFSRYSHELVSARGFRIYYDREGTRAPAPEPGDDAEHSAYARRVAAILDRAFDTYRSDPRFGGSQLDPSKLPTVQIVDLGWDPRKGDGSMGATRPNGTTTFLHHRLAPHVLEQTTAHELFHHELVRRVGPDAMDTHLWWVEAITEWAGSVVVPEHYARSSAVEVARLRPEPVASGIGSRLQGRTNDSYMAGDFVRYLERTDACPGIALASMQALRQQPLEAWTDVMRELAPRHCAGQPLDRVFDDYTVRHFLDGSDDIGGSTAELRPRQAPEGATEVTVQAVRLGGTRDGRVYSLRAPLSATPLKIAYEAGIEGTLVLRTDGGHDAMRYRVLVSQRVGGARTLRPLPGGGPFGRLLRESSPPLVLRGFGGGRESARTLAILATNPSPELAGEAALQFWLLEAVEGVAVAPPAGEGAPIRVSWQAAKLRTTDRGGPLERYRVYQVGPGGERLLAEISGRSTEALVRPQLIEGQPPPGIVVRLLDHLGNEGPDAPPVPLDVPRAQGALPPPVHLPPGSAPPGGCTEIYGLPGHGCR